MGTEVGGGREETNAGSLILLEGGRGGRDRKPNYVACSARLVGGWVVVA